MEVCVDSVESAMNAASGGATRVELCANLHEGGTTPSVGSLLVLKQSTDIPVFVMVRPRGGDFLYSDLEFEVMKKDVASLKMHCANGIVIGILTKEGDVDIPRCKELIELARPLPVTFHRAFDVCKDWKKALEDIISLGCTRVLTSGQESSALEGLATIELMVQQADGRIKVMPGGGINEANLLKIMEGSGAKEFHSSARSSRPSAMEYHNNKIAMGSTEAPSESIVKVTDASRVSQMKAILNQM